jgi:hypothetical protein
MRSEVEADANGAHGEAEGAFPRIAETFTANPFQRRAIVDEICHCRSRQPLDASSV